MGNCISFFVPFKQLVAIDITFPAKDEMEKELSCLDASFLGSLQNKWSVSNVLNKYSSSGQEIEELLENTIQDFLSKNNKKLKAAKIDFKELTSADTNFIGRNIARDIIGKIFNLESKYITYTDDIYFGKQDKFISPTVGNAKREEFYKPFDIQTTVKSEHEVLTNNLKNKIIGIIKDKSFNDLLFKQFIMSRDIGTAYRARQSADELDAQARYAASHATMK